MTDPRSARLATWVLAGALLVTGPASCDEDSNAGEFRMPAMSESTCNLLDGSWTGSRCVDLPGYDAYAIGRWRLVGGERFCSRFDESSEPCPLDQRRSALVPAIDESTTVAAWTQRLCSGAADAWSTVCGDGDSDPTEWDFLDDYDTQSPSGEPPFVRDVVEKGLDPEFWRDLRGRYDTWKADRPPGAPRAPDFPEVRLRKAILAIRALA